MWRWSYSFPVDGSKINVFSTYVEMIPIERLNAIIVTSILHVCGDDPRHRKTKHLQDRYSPRMWRWSYHDRVVLRYLNVFSTYVEMILFLNLPTWNHLCILHVCGDDFLQIQRLRTQIVYSPRMWRWSWVEQNFKDFDLVFSTYVEMILGQRFFASQKLCILHVCGDDPNQGSANNESLLYSPRMWRWS